MKLTFRSGDIAVNSTVTDLTVGLGRKFRLTIEGVRPGTRIRWTTENDPVLDLRESPDKLSAKVKATELGVGHVFIDAMGDLHRLRVNVIPMKDPKDEAVTLGGSIGEQSPDV